MTARDVTGLQIDAYRLAREGALSEEQLVEITRVLFGADAYTDWLEGYVAGRGSRQGQLRLPREGEA